MSPAPRRAAAAALAVALTAAGAARAADLYGKPLRGLSPVAVADVAAHPEKYAAKAIRVEGENAGAAGRPAIKDGEALLAIEADGFALPAGLAGGRLAAEGKAARRDGRAVFLATGLEVRR